MKEGTRPPSRLRIALLALAILAGLLVAGAPGVSGQSSSTGWKVIAWNNLGMHCMDADFSVFAILPPYNTIQAQVVDSSGTLLTTPNGVTLTYEGVPDATGSINTTSSGKTNFWSAVLPMFGVMLPVDAGLVGSHMPGPSNTPQPMSFDATYKWFIAEGIPITPYDNAGTKNYYPMMKVTARDSSGAALASTNIVLPVSDEMDCTACHASGSSSAAMPKAGWVNLADAQRDYRFNILRLHDDKQLGSTTYTAALSARGYSSQGLEATALAGKPILCANCHLSEALVGSGLTGIPPLTTAMHSLHATVTDPTNGLTLDSSTNRTACYRCHPGSETRCLRGAMGSAVAADGTMAMQCQNCHGTLSAVGDPARTGWYQEPTCQNCHTGTATSNSGQIRYTSAIASNGLPRVAADLTFATNANTPSAGFDLYRFSSGHGGLQCSACHGSTHAEYPTTEANDNVQSLAMQGHVGTIAECNACHATVPTTTNGGPHGMHPVGQSWVSGHTSAASANLAACQACHGTDYRGTVLSRAFGPRTLTTSYGTKTLFRGAQVGCYMCHNGPSSDGSNPNHAPVASNLSISATAGTPASVTLSATDADGNALTYRVVSQPMGGTAGLSGSKATYFPAAGFTGTDTFTYAAWDGSVDSNLATVTVSVSGSGGTVCSVTSTASAPSSATVGTPVTFAASATASNCGASATYDWNFGDGTPHATTATTSHTYSTAGTFQWIMTATAGGVASTRTGTITVSAPAPSCSLGLSASVPSSGTVGTAVTFQASATPSNCSGTVAYDWNFGDGTSHATTASATHIYSIAKTYTWTITASVAGVTAAKTGTIGIVSAQAPPPSVTGVTALTNPFRIQINGASFQQGVKVYLGGSTTAWSSVQYVNSSQLVLGGEHLSRQFPSGKTVSIKIVNPDGQSVTTSYTYTTRDTTGSGASRLPSGGGVNKS